VQLRRVICVTYIFSQICAILATIFLGITYISKNKRNVLLFCFVSAILYGFQYLLLGAFTGMVLSFLNIVRAVLFYSNNKKNKDNSIYSLLFLNTLFVLSAIFTWNGAISLLPLIASVLFAYSLWQKEIKLYREISVFVTTLWLIYDILVGTIFGCVSDVILILLELFGVFSYAKKQNK